VLQGSCDRPERVAACLPARSSMRRHPRNLSHPGPTGKRPSPPASPSILGMLTLDGLDVRYPDGVHALRDVSLIVPAGLFGLLGPNGAGKSTLMRTLATLQRPDRGRIRFGDVDVLAEPARLRAQLGYLPQDFGLYPTLTAHETLDHFAVLKGLDDPRMRADRVEAMLRRVNLLQVRDRRVDGFSGGMRQRLGIAIALVASPRLLIVDEPTAGLDPVERHRLLDLLAGVADDVVVLLSTHLVDDVEAVCERVALLVQGRIVREGTPATLVAEVRGRLWQARLSRESAQRWQDDAAVISRRLAPGGVLVHAIGDGPPDPAFTAVAPTLEDVYFAQLAQHGLRDDA
jgi:ABC-type multidrug transport system ATPase subunit